MSVRRNGGMADAYGSGPYGSNTVWVQVPSSALWKNDVGIVLISAFFYANRDNIDGKMY